MNYKEASDIDINKAVAAALGYELGSPGLDVYQEAVLSAGNSMFMLACSLPDYCTNPSEAWPIILSNRISIDSPILDDPWLARADGWHNRHSDENPLRAAMIVFLKKMEASRGEQET